jgi:ornithine cyclodeaminase/alanine dehydrogenase-like protein (mu-crystallin family)
MTHHFAGRRTLVLGLHEISELMSMESAIEVQRGAFMALASGQVTAAPNSWLRLPDQERRRGWLKILAGHDSSTGALGVKVLARFADNPPGANLGSLILLFDDEDGFPLSIMDGVLITALRTGAGAGLATENLACEQPQTVALIGTGVVAWHSLVATLIARPSIREVRVYSRSTSRREACADRVRSELGLAAVPAASVDAALDGAEVVITATNSPEPVVEARQLAPGVHVNAMGIRTELAPDVLGAAWVIPDGRTEALEDGKFAVAVAAGVVDAQQLGPQLGELLLHPPARRSDRVTVFDSSGVAAQDLAMANSIFDRARVAGAGTQVDMGLATELV